MNNILAAFIMLTRLPFWKIKEVPAECFKHVVPYWPLVGWLTGGVMAAVLWLAGQIMPVSLAWILALIARLLVTGCLDWRTSSTALVAAPPENGLLPS